MSASSLSSKTSSSEEFSGKLTLLTDQQLKKGYGTISSGNQGVSVAYASQLLNLDRPYIVVPETTPKPKLEKMEKFEQISTSSEKVLMKPTDSAKPYSKRKVS